MQPNGSTRRTHWEDNKKYGLNSRIFCFDLRLERLREDPDRHRTGDKEQPESDRATPAKPATP